MVRAIKSALTTPSLLIFLRLEFQINIIDVADQTVFTLKPKALANRQR